MKIKGAQSIYRIIDVMEYIVSANGTMRLKDISEGINLSTPTTYRLLSVLRDRGIVSLDPETHKYYIGEGSILNRAFKKSEYLRTKYASACQQISDKFGVATAIFCRDGFNCVCLHTCQGIYALQTPFPAIGQAIPLGSSGVSIAILMALPVDECEAIIEHNKAVYEPYIICTTDYIRSIVEQSRKRGYGYSYGISATGNTAISFPLYFGVELVGALSIVYSNTTHWELKAESIVTYAKEIILGGAQDSD